MEKLMRAAEMAPPTYESHHHKNSFVLRLLLHHFLNKKDLEWLSQFHSYDFSDTQKLALVFIREVGAIDNLSYRQLTSLSNIQSSAELRKLRKEQMIIQKGEGKSTYYLPSKLFNSFLSTQVDDLSPRANDLSPRGDDLSPRANDLSPKGDDLSPMADDLSPMVKKENLPEEMQREIKRLGKRTKNTKLLRQIIIKLCSYQPLSMANLSKLLNREERYLKKNYVSILLKEGILEYVIPEMISHPNQKYRTKNKNS